MKRLLIILLGLSILLSQTGCDKEGVCVKSTGKVIRESRPVEPFHEIEVNDNLNVFLTFDSTKYGISVEAGENLIAGIRAEVDSGRLVLKNDNACDWLRSFDVPVNIFLTFSYLDTIIYQAAGGLNCLNPWVSDSVYVSVVEGAGKLNLILDVERSILQVRYGTVNVNVSGTSGVTYISSQGYGPFHAEYLLSKFTYVYTFSPNDVFVYASEELGVEIGNIGNVHYTGDPKEISENIYGGGRLIKF